jgi:hypothetical protein
VHRWQDKKTGVIDRLMNIILALIVIPADEFIPECGYRCGSAKAKESYHCVLRFGKIA